MPETTRPTGHIAGPTVTVEERWIRQRCAWCGYILANYDLDRVAVPIGQTGAPGTWPDGAIVMVDGNASWVVEPPVLDAPTPLSEDSCARRETEPDRYAADG